MNRKIKDKDKRLGLEKLNNQSSLMRIMEYNNARSLVVEFQDKYKYKVHAQWNNFVFGNIQNPYAPLVYNIGIKGTKYPISKNKKLVKEYSLWVGMLERCFCKEYKEKFPVYQDVTCCEEWLLYENFYEWLHNQSNFEQWLNGGYALDKDILNKGNRIYSPDTCCLVPVQINALFTKSDKARGNLPIGVTYNNRMEKYCARVCILKNKNGKKIRRTVGYYPTPEDAFYLGYKPYKEKHIQRIAQEEFDKGNITKRCYDAMMNYKVEITD